MTPTQHIHSATRPGFVPAAQVTRGELVALASKALTALEEFIAALTPPVPVCDPPYATAAGIQPKPQRVDTWHTAGENCPECGDGPMVERASAYGKFFGCVNYPTCKGKRGPGRVSTQRGAMSQKRRTP
jgi:Topoisomerase DNA binding C4 zinc finger